MAIVLLLEECADPRGVVLRQDVVRAQCGERLGVGGRGDSQAGDRILLEDERAMQTATRAGSA